jgi:hypothetical protein
MISKDTKVPYNLQVPHWFKLNLFSLASAQGRDANQIIVETLLEKYPQLNRADTGFLKKRLQSAEL